MTCALAGPAPWQALAEPSNDQNRGNVPLRVAIVFIGSNAQTSDFARDVAQVITANLGRDRQLVLIDTADFIETITDTNKPPRFTDWRAINAHVLVTGRVRREAGDRLAAEFRLWDVVDGLHLFGMQYAASSDSQGVLAKEISNAVYERLTGKKGAFD